MKIVNLLLFIALLLKPTLLQYLDSKNEWVAWNIGQGQWITHIEGDTCLHYDVGGEISYALELRRQMQTACFHRKNRIFISHWDFDHYSFLKLLVRWVPRVCWINHPKWPTDKKQVSFVKSLLLPNCFENLKIATWRPYFYKNTNESSGVLLEQSVLIPGDSPLNKEKQWIAHFKAQLSEVKILILGHHGSHTSTGEPLLRRLTNLKMAIASARFAKYHHPHSTVLKRLKKYKIPVLKTEDWGHIHWQ